MNQVRKHNLTQNGRVVYSGSSDHCFIELQRRQSQSATYAMKYGGWKIEPTDEMIPDPIHRDAVLIDKVGNRVLYQYEGKQWNGAGNAIYGIFGLINPGDKFTIDGNYSYQVRIINVHGKNLEVISDGRVLLGDKEVINLVEDADLHDHATMSDQDLKGILETIFHYDYLDNQ